MMSPQPPPSALKHPPERATTAVAEPSRPSVLQAPQHRLFAQRLALLIARLRQAQQEHAADER